MTRCTCAACRHHDAIAQEEERNAILLGLEKLARRPSRRDPVAQVAALRHVTAREAWRGGVWGWLTRRLR